VTDRQYARAASVNDVEVQGNRHPTRVRSDRTHLRGELLHCSGPSGRGEMESRGLSPHRKSSPRCRGQGRDPLRARLHSCASLATNHSSGHASPKQTVGEQGATSCRWAGSTASRTHSDDEHIGLRVGRQKLWAWLIRRSPAAQTKLSDGQLPSVAAESRVLIIHAVSGGIVKAVHETLMIASDLIRRRAVHWSEPRDHAGSVPWPRAHR